MVASRSSFPTGAAARCIAGNLTPTGFSVWADFAQSLSDARVVVSVNSDLSSPVFTSAWSEPTIYTGAINSYRSVKFDVTGLTADTRYYYGIQSRNAPNNQSVTRTVKTPVTAGTAGAFAILAGSCDHFNPLDTSRALAKTLVHRAMALETDCIAFLHLDDLLYTNPDDTTPKTLRDLGIRNWANSPDVDALLRTMSLIYMPGDHDLGPNDSTLDDTNAESIYRASRQAYRESMPYYPFVQTTLGETDIDRTILTQKIDFGKIRFLLLDCMSQARESTGRCLGSAAGSGDYWDQLGWFATALTQAATDGCKWVFVCLPRGWMTYPQTSFADAFTGERTTICNLIEEADVRVCLLYGDTHASGVDDGTNVAAFSTDGFAGFPGILASALFNNYVAAGGAMSWNGGSTFTRFAASDVTDGLFTRLDFDADNEQWAYKLKGRPFDTSTFAPTQIVSKRSDDVTPAVSFNNAAPSVARNVPLTVNLDKTWFGSCSVTWTASTGQTGTATFKPNKSRATFSVTFSAAGSPTITLSNASGCTISGTNPATVTVT